MRSLNGGVGGGYYNPIDSKESVSNKVLYLTLLIKIHSEGTCFLKLQKNLPTPPLTQHFALSENQVLMLT